MESSHQAALRKVVLVVDAVLVCIAMALAFGVHSALRERTGLRPPPPFEAYAALATSAIPLWLLSSVFFDLHCILERVWTRAALLSALLRMHVTGLVALSVVALLTQGVVNRSLLGFFLGTSFVLMYAERRILTSWLVHQRARGHGVRRLLLVGQPGAAMRAFFGASRAAPLPPQVVGRIDAGALADGYSLPPLEREADVVSLDELPPSLGDVTELGTVLHEHPIDEVLFFPPLHEPRRAREALQTCTTHGVPASFAIDLTTLHEATPRVVEQLHQSFITFEVAPRPAIGLAIKHAADTLIALLAIVILAPLMVLVSVAILLSMGRPVLYSQERAGLRGRPFSMLKYRTMVRDAAAKQGELAELNEMAGPTFKLSTDPRVTRLGRILRKTSIDELPQLFNVLTGSMSLVGPRPLPVSEQQRIEGWHRRRLSMKPGITCLWQISGRNDVGFEQWMRLDLDYVDAWSLTLDAKILLFTVPAVLSGRGAR